MVWERSVLHEVIGLQIDITGNTPSQNKER